MKRKISSLTRRLTVLAAAVVVTLAGMAVVAQPAQANYNGDRQICVQTAYGFSQPGTDVRVKGFVQGQLYERIWDGKLRDYGKGYLEACTWGTYWGGSTTLYLRNPTTGWAKQWSIWLYFSFNETYTVWL